MSGIAYHGCKTTGHGSYSPTTLISTQSKVMIQGKPAIVEGDKIVPHSHDGTCIARTSKVFINGKKAIQIADDISCDDVVAQCSNKVFIK